jgi:hypothetical protein
VRVGASASEKAFFVPPGKNGPNSLHPAGMLRVDRGEGATCSTRARGQLARTSVEPMGRTKLDLARCASCSIGLGSCGIERRTLDRDFNVMGAGATRSFAKFELRRQRVPCCASRRSRQSAARAARHCPRMNRVRGRMVGKCMHMRARAARGGVPFVHTLPHNMQHVRAR